jgi:hypothetical protein
MKGRKMGSRAVWGTLVLVGLTVPLAGQQNGQNGQPAGRPEGRTYNERSAEKQPNAEDKSGIWILDFHFKDPRVEPVDIPGKGRTLVWYLWYQVTNNTGEPRTFIPDFIWVCHDEGSVHHDRIMPKAQMTIERIENRERLYDIKNSVTMALEPVPASKEFNEKGERVSYPKAVTGVAMWGDIDPKCDRFSIYVYGLSDGWAAVDGPDGKPIIRRKALQLKFKRLGDEYNQNSGQIRYQGYEWVYTTVDSPPLPSEMKKPAGKSAAAVPPGRNAARK